MGNMFLAGYFMSVTLNKIIDKDWGLAAMYGALTIVNFSVAMLMRGE